MVTGNCLIYLCLCMVPPVFGYRITKSDITDTIYAKAEEIINIVCEIDVPIARCGMTHPNGTKILFPNIPGASSCTFTTNATSSEMGLWTCHIWGKPSGEEIKKTVHVALKLASVDKESDHPNYPDTIHLDTSSETMDEDSIVISTTTYVCSTIAFLCIFFALVYGKYKYYALYYVKTWGDDDSIASKIMKIQADPAATQARDYLLIT